MVKGIVECCVRFASWSMGWCHNCCRVGDDDASRPDTPSSSADKPECFICATSEGDVWPSQCKCKDRFMHPECQLQFLKNRPDMTCPVCLEKYENVTSKKVRKLQWYRCNTGTFVVIMSFGLIAVFGCTLNTFLALAMKMRKGRSSMALLVSACSLGGLLTFMTGLLIRFVMLQGGVRAIVSSCFEYGHEKVTITKPPLKMISDVELGGELCELT